MQIGGDDKSNLCRLVLDGKIISETTISTAQLRNVVIGKLETSSNSTSSFDLQEFYAYRHHGNSDHINDFIKVTDWLKYR